MAKYIFSVILGFCLMASLAVGDRPKAAFKVLYSNDFTNITSCVSPYHQSGESWTPEMLKESVNESANIGIDVHLLQPAHGWVPWWPSEIYPMMDHHRWWYFRYGAYPNGYDIHDYIIGGGDPIDVFINRCRSKEMAAFISLRMNDVHHLEYTDTPGNTTGAHAICKFYAENPHYRLGTDLNRGEEKGQNWLYQEVRDYKFNLLREICENYDIDGLELDFMRHFWLFQTGKTNLCQRKVIMTRFIRKVRRLLDSTEINGKYRWLSVRIPVFTRYYESMGVDLKMWTDAGVDIVNASTTFFTIHLTDIADIVAAIPDYPVYLEMCHTTLIGTRFGVGDSFCYRRTTDEQYYTAAHLAYSRGAAGVSAFNFVYYREHGAEECGPFNEPPFHVFQHMSDPDWLAQQNQHYVLAFTNAYETPNIPQEVAVGQTVHFEMDMAAPTGGWMQAGKLRIQSEGDMGDAVFTAKINGTTLAETTDMSEPYPSPYTQMLGVSETLKGWTVPTAFVQNGINNIEITATNGSSITKIVFVDLAIQ